MMSRVRIDYEDVVRASLKSFDDFTKDYSKQVAEAGGKVLFNAYRKKLQKVAKSKSGSFYKNRGTAQQQIIEFQKSFDSVAMRTLFFKDQTGAYCVVGQAVNAKNRYFSPQAMWTEYGADGRSQPGGRGERYRYSDKVGTGVRIAEQPLENAAAETAEASLAAMVEKLRQCLSKQS